MTSRAPSASISLLVIHETIRRALNHSFVVLSTLLCKIRTWRRIGPKWSALDVVIYQASLPLATRLTRTVVCFYLNTTAESSEGLCFNYSSSVEVFFLGRWGGAASGVKWHFRGVIKIPPNPIAYSAKQALAKLEFLSSPNNEFVRLFFHSSQWDALSCYARELIAPNMQRPSPCKYKWKSHKMRFVMCFLIPLRSNTG